MLNQSLQQKLLQKLSPQQIQMIKLLEIPTFELEERIKKELEENPTLEEGKEDDNEDAELPDNSEEEESDMDSENSDEFSVEDYMDEGELPDYKLEINNYSKDEDKKRDIPFSVADSFSTYLESQLGLRVLTEHQMFLAKYLIGNIDEDGYLRRGLEAVADDIAFSVNVTTNEKELLEVLDVIQDLDPAGVGARSLQECLLLQIGRKNQDLPEVKMATTILKQNFDDFTRKHYDKIIEKLGVSEAELKAAVNVILKLNPKPGGSFYDQQVKTSENVIPDFILENNDGDLQLSLNSRNVPELRISRTYKNMLQSYSKSKSRTKTDKEAMTFVKQKIDSAKWFIDALQQRENTLMLTMNAIIEYQKEYFLEGDETKLRPMILKDIADITGLDISTISRVANSKYIQTHFGIFPLKYFFSEGIQTDSGEEVSTREIKKILKECLAAENKQKPVTDDQLSEILKKKGYQIARRTVAKYREQLNIPVARLRKEL
ncbi:MAG: RNA polymerase factor sigma-54 [Bacteroidota bacterium]|nr:RNA polymerase factor sigma-54 [Bacteroidota bacterium]MDP4226603.1 RNA polymerase factor sigma-54 [Bacteroidota bacterium]MDP4273875.1 RNA polymerase factor sigma-54 [Bacteroidota bacterium]